MILFIGGMNRDFFTVTPKFAQPGETVVGSQFFTGFGGKTINQCVAAKFLGAKVSVIGKVGKDENGRAYIEHLQSLNIDTQYVERVDHLPSGVATVIVNEVTGDNQIIIVPGANQALTNEDVERADCLFKCSSLVVCALEMPEHTVKAAFKKAKMNNIKTILNAAPANSMLDPEILQLTDILCVNELELEIMTGLPVGTETEILTACVELGKNVDIVIVTLGAKGAAFLSKDMDRPELVHMDNRDVAVVDTTGAGDAFVGALAFFLVQLPELELKKIIERSCFCATESVKLSGTQCSFSTRSKLPKYLFE